MGNILNFEPDVKLIRHLDNFHIKILNKYEHRQLEQFKFDILYRQNNVKLYTTYEYQKIGYNIPTNFILCKSSSIEDIIENTKLGSESIAYISWDYHEHKKILSINNILENPRISCYKLDLIEMHAIGTLRDCKTLRNHYFRENQDDQTYFKENNIIKGILYNFGYCPIQKSLLLNHIIEHNDIRSYIFKLYVRMLYVF